MLFCTVEHAGVLQFYTNIWSLSKRYKTCICIVVVSCDTKRRNPNIHFNSVSCVVFIYYYTLINTLSVQSRTMIRKLSIQGDIAIRVVNVESVTIKCTVFGFMISRNVHHMHLPIS